MSKKQILGEVSYFSFTRRSIQCAYHVGMRQKGTILPDSVDLTQAQNCQVDLTHANCWANPNYYEERRIERWVRLGMRIWEIISY